VRGILTWRTVDDAGACPTSEWQDDGRAGHAHTSPPLPHWAQRCPGDGRSQWFLSAKVFIATLHGNSNAIGTSGIEHTSDHILSDSYFTWFWADCLAAHLGHVVLGW